MSARVALAFGAALLALIAFALLREPREAAIDPGRMPRSVPVERADVALEAGAPRTELAAVGPTEARAKLPVPITKASATSAAARSELETTCAVRIEVELVPEGKAEHFVVDLLDAQGKFLRRVDSSQLGPDRGLSGLAPGDYALVLRDRANEPHSMYLVPGWEPLELRLTLAAGETRTARFRVPTAGRVHLDFGAAPTGLFLEVRRRRLDRMNDAKSAPMGLILDGEDRRAVNRASTWDNVAAPGRSYDSPPLTPGHWELSFVRVSDGLEIERREILIRAGEVERVRY